MKNIYKNLPPEQQNFFLTITEYIDSKFDSLEKALNANTLNTKSVLNHEEAASYICKSPSTLYKLTADRKINFSKPNGKCNFYQKVDLDKWLTENRHKAINDDE